MAKRKPSFCFLALPSRLLSYGKIVKGVRNDKRKPSFCGWCYEVCTFSAIQDVSFPRCRMVSAMHDVGTYRQVRPTCQPTGGYAHRERMCRNNRRPIPAMGAFSAMHDVGTYRQVRPLCQLADGCIHKERINLTTVVE